MCRPTASIERRVAAFYARRFLRAGAGATARNSELDALTPAGSRAGAAVSVDFGAQVVGQKRREALLLADGEVAESAGHTDALSGAALTEERFGQIVFRGVEVERQLFGRVNLAQTDDVAAPNLQIRLATVLEKLPRKALELPIARRSGRHFDVPAECDLDRIFRRPIRQLSVDPEQHPVGRKALRRMQPVFAIGACGHQKVCTDEDREIRRHETRTLDIDERLHADRKKLAGCYDCTETLVSSASLIRGSARGGVGQRDAYFGHARHVAGFSARRPPDLPIPCRAGMPRRAGPMYRA